MVDLPTACRRGLVDYSLALFNDVEHVARVTLLARHAVQPLRLAQVAPSSSACHGPLLPEDTTGSHLAEVANHNASRHHSCGARTTHRVPKRSCRCLAHTEVSRMHHAYVLYRCHPCDYAVQNSGTK